VSGNNDINLSVGLDFTAFENDQKAIIAKAKQLKSELRNIPAAEVKARFGEGASKAEILRQLDKVISDVNAKLKNDAGYQLTMGAVKADKKAASDVTKEAERIAKGQEDAAKRGIALEQRREEEARKTSAARVRYEIDADKKIAAEAEKTAKLRSAAEAKVTKALDFKASPEQQYKRLEQAAIASAFGFDKSTYALERFAGQLPRLRYAMYDVSNTALLMGGSLTAVAVTAGTLAAQYDRDFANVARTTGVAGNAAEQLKQQFIDLKTSIPVSWAELTNIGSLAGQLDIANKDVAGFTETVAMFSATTDVSATEAATAFGRLDQLLGGDVTDPKRFEELGSAILAVGTSSVATESQIIGVATQIASIGNLAGFTAAQVIGLSGALASVGIAPEAARGLTTRVFGEIDTAISQGSVALENFAQVSGMSAQQFSAAWNTNAAGTFVQFLKGIDEQGGNAQAKLAQLGITSVRDVPNILKLADSYGKVGELLGTSTRAYSQADELQKQYAVITQTVAEKMNLLVQNVQMFIAASGQGVNALGGFLNMMNDTLATLINFSQTSFGGAVLGWTSTLAGLSGVLILIAGGLMRGVASFLAWKTATIEAGIASGIFTEANTAANTSVTQLGAKLLFSAGALKAFGTALKGASILGLVTIGLSLATEAFTAMGEAMKSPTERAKDMFGSFDALSQAIKADAASIGLGEQAVGTFTSAIDGSTTAIGRNTAELIANTLQSDESFKKILEAADKVKAAGGPILDQPKFIAMYVKGDTDAALAYYADYEKKVAEFQARQGTTATPSAQSGIGAVSTTGAMTGGLINSTQDTQIQSGADVTGTVAAGNAEVKASLEAVSAAVSAATEKTAIFDDTMKALGFDTTDAAGGLKDYSSALSEYRSAVEDAFGQQNLMSAFSSDFENLVTSIAEGGTSFSSFSEAGRANLDGLQSSIGSTLAAAKTLGVDASEAVAAQFLELQKQGVDTAQLMTMLAGMNLPGVDVKAVGAYIAGTKQMTSSGSALAGTFSQIGTNARGAAKDIGGVTAKVVTLTDYANDLSSVWKRAFEIRFDAQAGLDKITKGWRDMAQATDDAKQEIKDINSTIDGLTSDKKLQEYFLSVAEAYGDSLKASQIRSDIADIDSQLANEQKNLSKAQSRANKTLVGNSEAAIANRAEITGMVSDYQDYIKSLAASGASQAELAVATTQAKADFMAQATQLGYNSTQLGTYSAAFDDVSTAIDNVPRNVTVTADTNPALQALNEFQAKLKAQSGNKYSVGSLTVEDEATKKMARGQVISARIAVLASKINSDRSDAAYGPELRRLQTQLQSGNYADGGFTGTGGKYQVAGIVHKGEYVVPKEQVNQSTGLPYFMSQMPKFFAGGPTVGGNASSGGVVSLSPEDRALLRNVGGSGEVVLYANNEAIARSANAGNKQIVATGGRP
jgi:TP901 family phage tail tape measure protein